MGMIDRLISILTTLKTSGLNVAGDKKLELIILAAVLFDVFVK